MRKEVERFFDGPSIPEVDRVPKLVILLLGPEFSGKMFVRKRLREGFRSHRRGGDIP
jgi:hypothetical protein